MTTATRRSAFPRMAQVVKPGQQGVAKVEHFTVSVKDSRRTEMFASIHNDRYGIVDPGKYAKLTVHGELMMTDTNMERITNTELLRRAHGRVLVGGLGLGMVIHGLMQKPEVEHVTVVEKHQDVVDLIAPTLAKYDDRVSIVVADILAWKAPKGQLWDIIYMDIWPNVCMDNLPEMAVLSRRYSPRLNRQNANAWMGGWRIEELRARRSMGRY